MDQFTALRLVLNNPGYGYDYCHAQDYHCSNFTKLKIKSYPVGNSRLDMGATSSGLLEGCEHRIHHQGFMSSF
jgi:hypothetical protein